MPDGEELFTFTLHNGAMTHGGIIAAAGGVVWRKAGSGRKVELLLVHRPNYNDWTFPKGKLDPGESLPAAAVREVQEESGIATRLTLPLPQVNYRVKGGTKQVSWWLARPLASSKFVANNEVDKARWLSPRDARKKLTYPHDRQLVDVVEDLVADSLHRSRTLIVLRHAEATPRDGWQDPDAERPLTENGQLQAKSIVAALRAFGIGRIVSSPALRCQQTVEPLANELGLRVRTEARLTEGTEPAVVHQLVDELMNIKKPLLICTHRPVLPDVFGALPLLVNPLELGQAQVLHHRKGRTVGHELLS